MKRYLYHITSLIICLMIGVSAGFAQIGKNDSTFNIPDTGPNIFLKGPDSWVRASAIQSDQKIVLSGEFNTYNGVTAHNLVRINPDGSYDNTFNPGTGTNAAPMRLIVQPDNRIILIGNFTTFNGSVQNRIVRLLKNGTPDSTFETGSGFDAFPTCMALQPDGKLIVAGRFNTYNGTPAKRLVRLNSNGHIDTTFHSTDLNNYVDTLRFVQAEQFALRNDGKLIFGVAHYEEVRLLLLNADGSRDTSFTSSTPLEMSSISTISCIRLQDDGKILFGGYSIAGNSPQLFLFHRILTNGQPDSTFKPVYRDRLGGCIYNIELQQDHKIIVSGRRDLTEEGNLNLLTRLNEDGSLDSSFYRSPSIKKILYKFNKGNNFTYNTLIQPDGKVLVGGFFVEVNSYTAHNLARLNTDGSMDVSFNPSSGVNGEVFTSFINPDGKILIGGCFSAVQHATRSHVARLNEDGTLDPSFDPGSATNGPVYALITQPDGKSIIAGDFNHYNGQPAPGIVRVNTDGSHDASFNPRTGTDGLIRALQLQADGKLIIGGEFRSVQGVARVNVARLNADGTLDNSFISPLISSPGLIENIVYSLLVLPSGKIMAGGSFRAFFKEVQREHLIRLYTNGMLDTTYKDMLYPYTKSMILQPDGKIIAAGGTDIQPFVSSGGFIRRFNTDGAIDTSFKNNFEPGNAAICSITRLHSGKIIGGGEIEWFAQASRGYLFLMDSTGVVDNSFIGKTNAPVYTTQLVSNEKIIIGGGFTDYTGIPRTHIARIFGTDVILHVGKSAADNNWIMYPNPASIWVNIEGLKTGSTITIRNLIGAVVKSEEASKSSYNLNVSGFKSGIYLVTITDKNGSFTKHLIVTNK